MATAHKVHDLSAASVKDENTVAQTNNTDMPTISDSIDYSQMHSADVDVTTLPRAVLCKDGWVVPFNPKKGG